MQSRWPAVAVVLVLALTPRLSRAERGNVIATSVSNVVLGTSRIAIPLEPATTISPNRLNSYLKNSNRRIYLVLRGPGADEQPGVIYNLYLDLPEASMPLKEDVHFIDSLNFYGAVPLEGATAPAKEPFRSYEITGLLKKLAARNLLTESMTLTIIPSGVPASNANARIRRIEIVEQ
jgi:hypothetical protein